MSKWISVKDKLPPEGENVLLSAGADKCWIGSYQNWPEYHEKRYELMEWCLGGCKGKIIDFNLITH